ncbi:hypothetical protein CP980_32515 [Streptomyces vinaceus]|uniref:Uncharacterized protein n=1 Tax=Streptomyces vinaceus TaxID=1960 RepID=A0A5J6JGP5_STRVI|nr:hypothetical protein [Streptomyces vinaceus]QEV49173.1 hypothetical protein CP980_32515 [Streptomyces vinaceus]
MPRTRRRTALLLAAPSLCTVSGTGLTRYTRVVFGSLGPGGCFTGEEGADVVALSATALIATAPEWPAAATVSV